MYEKHIYDLAANFRVTYKLPMEDQEDLQQDLRIKLISLDQKYRGPERRQYVKTALNNFCRDRWRRIMLYQKRNDPMMDKHINMQYAPDYTSEIEESHLISTLFQSISPVQKKIVQMHLGIGYPTRTENMRKIGKEVGLHEDEVRKELAMAMYKMKQLVQSGVVE
jgi:RNA polymerase sigma factor (sigma-70 family)